MAVKHLTDPEVRVASLERALIAARAEIAALRTSRDAWLRLCVSGRRPPHVEAPIALAEPARVYPARREREGRRQMPITGSDKALMQNRAGHRATRAGYFTLNTVVTIFAGAAFDL